MEAFPTVVTNRLVLNQFIEKDISFLVKYGDNINVARNTLNIPNPYTVKDAEDWIKMCKEDFLNKTRYSFAIRRKEDMHFIGGIGLTINKRFNHAELGYWIGEPFWNSGYATEAAGSVIAFGFETLGLHKIYATHILENPASGKVMQHIGMIKEAEMIDHSFRNGKYSTLIQYGIITTKKES